MSGFSYDLIKKAMDVSSLRQKSISSNISNINTPDYKANRVKFEEYLQNTKKVHIKKTDKRHFGIESIKDINPEMEKRDNISLRDDGNSVDIDIEMADLAANEIYYNVLTRQISSKLSNLNYVINKG